MTISDKAEVDSLYITISDEVVREYVSETYDPEEIYTVAELTEALEREEK